MPVDISFGQIMSFGALCASAIFLLVLLVVALLVIRGALGVASRFESFGAERVNGRIQMRGLFGEQAKPIKSGPSRLAGAASALKAASDFTPSAEDLDRVEKLENGSSTSSVN